MQGFALKKNNNGADSRIRTGDPILTMDVLYLLSYNSKMAGVKGIEPIHPVLETGVLPLNYTPKKMVGLQGLEPRTNRL